jgi:hypothetical protein
MTELWNQLTEWSVLQEMNAKEFNNLDYKEWHIGIVRNLLHFMLKPCMLLVVVPLDNPTQMAVWIWT